MSFCTIAPLYFFAYDFVLLHAYTVLCTALSKIITFGIYRKIFSTILIISYKCKYIIKSQVWRPVTKQSSMLQEHVLSCSVVMQCLKLWIKRNNDKVEKMSDCISNYKEEEGKSVVDFIFLVWISYVKSYAARHWLDILLSCGYM